MQSQVQDVRLVKFNEDFVCKEFGLLKLHRIIGGIGKKDDYRTIHETNQNCLL